MRALEQTIFRNGFPTGLLCAEAAPGGGRSWRAEWRMFDGGRLVETRRMMETDDPSEFILGLRRRLIPFQTHPGLVAGAGRGWTALLSETLGLELVVPALDLRGAALALRPALPARTDRAGLLRAFGLAAGDEEPPAAGAWADLLWAVIHEASERDLATEDLLRLPAAARKIASFDHYAFTADALRAAPETPGVYVMRDRAGRVLYVGQSDHLRRRLLEYFQSSRTLPAKIERLRDRLYDIECHPAGSELEALLWEQRLIREHAPEINVARRVEEDASRYAAPAIPVAMALPSRHAGAVDLWMFGPGPLRRAVFQAHPAAAQLTLKGDRPSRTRVASLVRWFIQPLDGHRRKPSKAWTDWGAEGAELCRRYFGRHRDRLQWMEVAGAGAVDRLLTLVRHAAGHPYDPAEWRSAPDSAGPG